MSLCGRLDDASAKVRGVPPSPVAAPDDRTPHARRLMRCTHSVYLTRVPLLPPVNEEGVETHEKKNWNSGILPAPGTAAGERGGCAGGGI